MVCNKGVELPAFFSKFQSSFLQNFARETARYTVVDCFKAQANLVLNHLLFFQQENSPLATQESFKRRIYSTKAERYQYTAKEYSIWELSKHHVC